MEVEEETQQDGQKANESQGSDNGPYLNPVATALAPFQQKSAGNSPQDGHQREGNGSAPPVEAKARSFFSKVQWTPDGTSLLLTSKSNHQLDTYVLPPDLLITPRQSLSTYQSLPLPSPLYASAIHPQFALSFPSSCVYLASLRGLPIRLLSPFTPNILATYPLYNETRELWITPHSLVFHSSDHNTFYAGKGNEVCVFDLGRDGEGPYASFATGRRKRKQDTLSKTEVRYGVHECNRGLSRGLVSAMDMSLEGMLAIGTFTGEIGLMDTKGADGNITKLPLPAHVGSGVTELKFHPDPSRQNYLVAASRKSETLEVFDVRNTEIVLASLEERAAMTQQRMGFDITEQGEVWAGGTDGFIRVWEGLGMDEGEVQPARRIKAHDDAVGGIGLHPGGAGVLATCAGSKKYEDPDVELPEVNDLTLDDGSSGETSLKVWSVRQ